MLCHDNIFFIKLGMVYIRTSGLIPGVHPVKMFVGKLGGGPFMTLSSLNAITIVLASNTDSNW